MILSGRASVLRRASPPRGHYGGAPQSRRMDETTHDEGAVTVILDGEAECFWRIFALILLKRRRTLQFHSESVPTFASWDQLQGHVDSALQKYVEMAPLLHIPKRQDT